MDGQGKEKPRPLKGTSDSGLDRGIGGRGPSLPAAAPLPRRDINGPGAEERGFSELRDLKPGLGLKAEAGGALEKQASLG